MCYWIKRKWVPIIPPSSPYKIIFLFLLIIYMFFVHVIYKNSFHFALKIDIYDIYVRAVNINLETSITWYFRKYYSPSSSRPKLVRRERKQARARSATARFSRRETQTDVLTDIFLAGQSVLLARRTTLRTPRQASANLGK